MNRTIHAEYAWLGGDSVTADVRITVEGDRILAVEPMTPPQPNDERLLGLTVPGLVNTHSHVFHRAIRGHTQSGVADFWRWRDLMYRVAGILTPDTFYDLAYATYVEMALAGITAVGEFHYLHHDRDGTPYADPNEMGRVVMRAATDAGLRITLLDTCYLRASTDDAPLTGVQTRFGDGSWEGWAERVGHLSDHGRTRIGAAIHSVRAVPREALAPLASWTTDRAMPLHVHLSEQPAENDACLATYGVTPTRLLAQEGVLGKTTTAVHATHLTASDIGDLTSSGTTISMCCTTERDLADGIGPAVRLHHGGSPLCVGSDAHMMIDLWEEARAIELNERLASGVRGHLPSAELMTALTASGAHSLGWESGRIAPGALADLTTVSVDSPRTAGSRTGEMLAHVVFAATSGDVTDVIVDGRDVVRGGRHVGEENPGSRLNDAIAAVLVES